MHIITQIWTESNSILHAPTAHGTYLCYQIWRKSIHPSWKNVQQWTDRQQDTWTDGPGPFLYSLILLLWCVYMCVCVEGGSNAQTQPHSQIHLDLLLAYRWCIRQTGWGRECHYRSADCWGSSHCLVPCNMMSMMKCEDRMRNTALDTRFMMQLVLGQMYWPKWNVSGQTWESNSSV